jgi:hypothetical protein
MPHDLREAIKEKKLSPAEAMQALVLRAEQGEMVALLVLGGRQKGPVEEEDEVVEDTGLLALAHSIREVGLRQPINVYRIDDPERPDQPLYRLGEGERRFWAHHLLIQRGHEEFNVARCIVESLPEDEDLVHQRQEAENAARVDLPALARARSIKRIRDRLNTELGTWVPGENTFKLPSQRELQTEVGLRVKSFTGRAIGDRMVRNYLALLNLSDEIQDLAEAAQLTEKQLRPVIGLKTDKEQLEMVQRIIEKKWSGRQVQREITQPPIITSSLKEISQSTVEQRFEKRVIDAAKTIHTLLTLPEENYEEAVIALAVRARDPRMRQAIQSLRQTLEEVLLKVEDLSSSEVVEVSLLSILPPLAALRRHLSVDEIERFETEAWTGSQVLDYLFERRQEDLMVASRLEPFFNQVEFDAEALRAKEGMALPVLRGEKREDYPNRLVYRVKSGASIYWAHELLVKRGEAQFKTLRAEIEGIDYPEEEE